LYDLEGSHQGCRLNGRTPQQALREALGVAMLPSLEFETIDEPSIVAVQTQPEEFEIEPENAESATTPRGPGVGELLDLYALRQLLERLDEAVQLALDEEIYTDEINPPIPTTNPASRRQDGKDRTLTFNSGTALLRGGRADGLATSPPRGTIRDRVPVGIVRSKR
jgi:hypothetical protein